MESVVLDLRSDTVTRPTPGMLSAMTAAEVGDDVWGDDPTVIRLQSALAERAGHSAGLFFPSGTQSNLAAIMAHCERGDEYIVGQQAHTYKYEGGGAAVLGSVQPQPIENAPDGSIPLEKIHTAIKPRDIHFARTRLLALENTIAGKVIDLNYQREATHLARKHGLGCHLDGARLFNASVASGNSLQELCAQYDTVSICFSKGLGAPVGSVLVGRHELIERALRWRKVLGGGMRQSGFLAAACLYALNHHVERLIEDHENAHYLSDRLQEISEFQVQSHATNMVMTAIPPTECETLEKYLHSKHILVELKPVSRFVMHLDVTRSELDRFVSEIKNFYSSDRKIS